MNIPFLDLRKVDEPYINDLRHALDGVVSSGRYLLGDATRTFETDMERYHDMPAGSTVAVSNGLDAIRLILKSFIELGRISPGDEVIVPANTYIASLLPVTEFGLKPILIEPDPSTLNLDWHKAEQAITPRTKAVMVVHLYGSPCWNGNVARRMRDNGIYIIEDNAQAIGARALEAGLNGNDITGTLGHAAAFSFYPTKNIGALGDAGMVMSSDPNVINAIRTIANYGSDRRYHNIYQGLNCRIDELQAAALSVKLRHLDAITLTRRHRASLYNELIHSPLITKPLVMPDKCQVWHQYVVRCPERDNFREYLKSNGIATDIHYAVPPHLQPCYASLLHSPLPITEMLANEMTSLPIAATNDEEIAYIASVINAWRP